MRSLKLFSLIDKLTNDKIVVFRTGTEIFLTEVSLKPNNYCDHFSSDCISLIRTGPAANHQ